MNATIGQPKNGNPEWYTKETRSYLEKTFAEGLGDLTDIVEEEKWFGDKNNPYLYRVDFIIMDARLIIELDGYKYHSTKKQLTNDAERRRYLTLSGYTVINFTYSEIDKDCAACVANVRAIYNRIMYTRTAIYRAMYIDYPFYCEELEYFLNFQKDLQKNTAFQNYLLAKYGLDSIPKRELQPIGIDKMLPSAIDWLHEKSHISVFIFYPQNYEKQIIHLNGAIIPYYKGEMTINLVKSDDYVAELCDHLTSHSHLFDEFMLMGDNHEYIEPFISVLPSVSSVNENGGHDLKYLKNGKLLRRRNESTSYANTDLENIKWQNIYYAIGESLGLETDEM